MRVSIFCIIYLLVIQLVKAQPALNSVTIPDIGTSISVQTESDNTVDPGPGGNQIWDFSGVAFSNTAQTFKIQNPTNAPNGSSFPSATIAEVSPAESYAYYNLTSAQQVLEGFSGTVSGYSATFSYHNPVNLILYPIAYQTPQSDNFASSFSVYGFPGSSTGTISTEYDGFGTLITSLGTYADVVRIKSVRDETYELNSPFGSGSVATRIETYSWIKPGSYFPIFSIQDVSSNSSTTRIVSHYGIPLSYTKDLNVQDLTLLIGPNPTLDKVYIDFKDAPVGTYEISLWNEKGALVSKSSTFASNGYVHFLNLYSLSCGIYIVKVSSDKGDFIEKIIKI